MIYETERLFTREMTPADLPSLAAIMQDPKVMTAFEHAFSPEETRAWLKREMNRYQEYGFGLWAVALKETGRMIGQCGLILNEYDGAEKLEIAYLFQKAFWHQGYAVEAALGARQYAFETMNAPEVSCIVRENNLASMNVAIRLGMLVRGRLIKHYYDMDMPHYVFTALNSG
jgi:Acetyltransferases, including N-acetylases of ribosomal proteins